MQTHDITLRNPIINKLAYLETLFSLTLSYWSLHTHIHIPIYKRLNHNLQSIILFTHYCQQDIKAFGNKVTQFLSLKNKLFQVLSFSFTSSFYYRIFHRPISKNPQLFGGFIELNIKYRSFWYYVSLEILTLAFCDWHTMRKYNMICHMIVPLIFSVRFWVEIIKEYDKYQSPIRKTHCKLFKINLRNNCFSHLALL